MAKKRYTERQRKTEFIKSTTLIVKIRKARARGYIIQAHAAVFETHYDNPEFIS